MVDGYHLVLESRDVYMGKALTCTKNGIWGQTCTSNIYLVRSTYIMLNRGEFIRT